MTKHLYAWNDPPGVLRRFRIRLPKRTSLTASICEANKENELEMDGAELLVGRIHQSTCLLC